MILERLLLAIRRKICEFQGDVPYPRYGGLRRTTGLNSQVKVDAVI